MLTTARELPAGVLRDSEPFSGISALRDGEHPCGRDPVFNFWAATELLWLPHRGMGWYPVTEAPYDEAYFAKYARYAETEMGRRITAARVDLVNRHAGPGASVCDVGIGCGDFVQARPNTFGSDCNPAGVSWLLERGLLVDPTRETFDALTFWDSIEHIPDPSPLLTNAREWVFVSLPVVPNDGPPAASWKHYREDEHCWYWTLSGFLRWMMEHGFVCKERNTVETDLGREDVHSFAFRRVR
jgi:hypothetical protein